MEKLFNALLGLSLWSWALIGMVRIEGNPWEEERVRLCLIVLQVAVGFLLMLRRPVRVNGDMSSILRAVPSLLVAGILFRMAHPLEKWPGYAEVFFVGGTLVVLLCFAFLGRDFAVMPARRGIVRRGPYQLIRHPAYFAEFLMVTACLLARPSWQAGLLFASLPYLLVLRIEEEERLLSADHEFRKYKAQTRWRLLPGIW